MVKKKKTTAAANKKSKEEKRNVLAKELLLIMRHIKIIKSDKLGFSVFLIFTLQFFFLNPVNYLLYCLDTRCSFQIIYFDRFTLFKTSL